MSTTMIKNAVIFKEMTLTMKHVRLIVATTVLNALMTIAALITIFVFGISATTATPVATITILWIFIALIVCEGVLIAFIVPAMTASSISGERERQTLEVLLTTKLSTWQIIIGKYVASMLSIVLILLSSVPFMGLVFIYGGINIFQMFGIVVMIIFSAMYMATFGIWFSTLTKKTLPATVLSYLWSFLLLGGSITMSISLCAAFALGNGIMEETSNYAISGFLPVVMPLFIMLVNPVVSVFDAVGHMIGYSFGDDITLTGMYYIAKNLDLKGYRIVSIFLQLWTPLSMLVQALIGFLMLKWSAYLLNPTRGNKSHMKQTEKMIAKKKKELQQAES